MTALAVPEEYGGSGVDILSAIVVIEELAKRGTSLAGRSSTARSMAPSTSLENGNEAQKQSPAPKFTQGEILFAYGLSEPGVGGDLAWDRDGHA